MLRIKKTKEFLLVGENIFKEYSFPFFARITKKYDSFKLFTLLKGKLNRDILNRFFYPSLIYRSHSSFNKNWLYNYFFNYYSFYKFNWKQAKMSGTVLFDPLNQNLSHLISGMFEAHLLRQDKFSEKQAIIANALTFVQLNQNFNNLKSNEYENQLLMYPLARETSSFFVRNQAKNKIRSGMSTIGVSKIPIDEKEQQLPLHYLAQLKKLDGKKSKNFLQQELPVNAQTIPATMQKKQHNEPYFNMSPVELSHLVPKMLLHAGLNEFGDSETKRLQFNNADDIQKPFRTAQEPKTMDINNMADQVYRLIEKKVQIENERMGRWY